MPALYFTFCFVIFAFKLVAFCRGSVQTFSFQQLCHISHNTKITQVNASSPSLCDNTFSQVKLERRCIIKLSKFYVCDRFRCQIQRKAQARAAVLRRFLWLQLFQHLKFWGKSECISENTIFKIFYGISQFQEDFWDKNTWRCISLSIWEGNSQTSDCAWHLKKH